jgi:hypothetical protein
VGSAEDLSAQSLMSPTKLFIISPNRATVLITDIQRLGGSQCHGNTLALIFKLLYAVIPICWQETGFLELECGGLDRLHGSV